MDIFVWGINYAPEITGIGPYNTEMCEFLAASGHSVEMVTSFSYYPFWEKKQEDRGRLFRTENLREVRLHRCWLYVPKRVRALARVAHEASFVLSSLLKVLCLKRPDIYVVVSPPLFLGIAAAFASRVKGAPFIFHVQDLQPDAAIRLGMLKTSPAITRFLYAMEARAYAYASRVSMISTGMLRMLQSKGIPDSKLILFPNWVRLPATLPARMSFRRRAGLNDNAFVVVYAGNLGVKQGLGGLVEAASLLQHARSEMAGAREIVFVIAGAGAYREKVLLQVERNHLKNVILLPLQLEQAYHELLVDADCCAITQQPGTGSLFFPSKLLTTLAFGKPVLSIADPTSDLALAVAEGGAGVNVAPGNPQEVVEVIERWSRHPEELERCSEAGRKFVARFEMHKVLARFEAELCKRARKSRSEELSAESARRTMDEANSAP